MDHPGGATTRVADFRICHTRFLDQDGQPTCDWPQGAGDAQSLRRAYQLMVRTRAFDQKAIALQRTGKIGTYASSLGEEAVGAAIGLALAAADVHLPYYRHIAAGFARGVSMAQELYMYLGDERGGVTPQGVAAWHDFPPAIMIAAQVPQAVGVAYSFHLRRQARVALASCGDGATSKGDFAESVSAAGVWKLPLVFVVINNQWAISTPVVQQTGARTLAQKGIAGGLSCEQVDGNDFVATRFVIARAVERARQGGGPSLVEALTYRMGDHTTADDARRYRDAQEVEAAQASDPIARLRRYLEARCGFTATEDARLQAEAAAEVDAAVREVIEESRPLPPEAMFDQLYAELPAAYAWQRDEVMADGRAARGGR